MLSMHELVLSNVTPREPRVREDFDPRLNFLERMHDRTSREPEVTQSLFLRQFNGQPADAYHKNYMEYLLMCWGGHLGVVISPDILWYGLLCEIGSLIASDVEGFRPLFSTSHEEQALLLATNTPNILPLDDLIQMLKQRIPTDAATFLPSFTTTTERSQHAMYTAFCDAVSPYYSYWTFSCNFPAIRILGTPEDWLLLQQTWGKVITILAGTPKVELPLTWFEKVGVILGNCISQANDVAWWKEMFKVERCGSGGEVEVKGWFTQLFREQPQGVRKPVNFSTHIASVKYTNLTDQKEFVLKDGIFTSQRDGIFMVPDFGSCLLERRVVKGEKVTGWPDANAAVARFLERHGERVGV